MKYRTLIIDDEQEALNRLIFHLNDFDELEIIGQCSNGKEALKSIVKNRPDIVLIDIEMPEMNGIEVLRNIKHVFPYFIFVTAYSHYAIEAFEQHAIDYILKPYSKERIKQALNRAISMIQRDQLAQNTKNYHRFLSENIIPTPKPAYIKRIAAKSLRNTVFIDVNKVIYVEAANQYVTVFTEAKTFVVRESMDKLEQTLDPSSFFRTHRTYIVNLDHIEAIENVDKHLSNVILKNGKRIKISNNRKSKLNKSIGASR
ncbi:LytTR family DNA-binding domain-containing protein [Aquimarina gracilis]|uniref:LytTR family DNA-binding domain-containing protein n=1 Tax=Aquimarina gracilis TaxID=874422 RepID=A0ABU5ZP39_9FLAO|nr:LytTR family DNA-binding domain-containing protein [Aquimarina gracilis]MEB3343902.1 LytTR family DNA-binding domain-containing protein [Aquimarina gracilis]